MNILLITQEDILAGSTYSVSYLAKGLSARGHKVIVAARPGSVLHQILEEEPITFIPFTIPTRFHWASVRTLVRLVRQHQIQVINAQSSKDRYITVLARWFYRIPVLLIHTRRQVSMSVGGFFQNLVYVKGTDKIVAVSEGVKRSLIENRVPAQHIAVVYNGTPTEKYTAINADVITELKAKFSIAVGDVVIGCISRRKKQEQLLQSLDLIGKPVKVILVGIQEDEELEKIRANLTLPHQIFYEGEKEGAYALNYYKIFTCTVLCSTIEGLSQGLLESMYLGTPVIATAAAGNIDLIKHNENGLLFEDNDIGMLSANIQTIINDPKLREKLISGGITTASDTFSIERTLTNYEKLYTELLTSHKN